MRRLRGAQHRAPHAGAHPAPGGTGEGTAWRASGAPRPPSHGRPAAIQGGLRESEGEPAGGAASPPQERSGARRGGAREGKGRLPRSSRSVRPDPRRGVLSWNSFYAEQKRHPLNGARLAGLRFFSSPLNPADAAHLLGSKPFCSMFFQPQRRDHRLRGALLDSPGLRAAPVPRCAPASDVGLSVRMRVLRPCRDSSPGSPRSSATQSLAHGHKWGSHLFQEGTAEGPQKGPHAIPQSCSCSAEEHLCPC